jgi:hypothetical protein
MRPGVSTAVSRRTQPCVCKPYANEDKGEWCVPSLPMGFLRRRRDSRSADIRTETANANLSALHEFAVRAGDEIYEIKGPDDYTAGLYSYSFGAAGTYLHELCVGSAGLYNRALREALEPVLMAPEFDEPAWLSLIETSALWLVVDWIRRLDPIEAQHVLKHAAMLMPSARMGSGDVADRLAREFHDAGQRVPDRIYIFAANSVCLAASEGAIGLDAYEQGQDAHVPAEAWSAGTARLAKYMSIDDFQLRAEAGLARAARST